MTLILTVANVSGACQSSDYQLTDSRTGKPVSDRAGSKQLQASYGKLDLRLAFTGIASVGVGSARKSTIDWLSEELKGLSQDSPLQEICEALMRRGVLITQPHGVRGVLELVLTAAAVGEHFCVAVISNVDWRKRPPEAKSRFTIRIHTITKPFHLISGYRDSVPALERHRLRALARDVGKQTQQVLDGLANINVVAAKRSGGYVSEACWVTSQTADRRVRRSASLNIGQHHGSIPLLVGGADLNEWVTKNFRAAPGLEINLVQSAGAMYGPGDATPLPPPSGATRQFNMSGSSVVAPLLSPAGAQCASITITQLHRILEMLCNEEVVVPFAKIALSSVGSIVGAFPKPLFPWPRLKPALTIGNASVPRGWEYEVGYWIVGGAHHVIIPTVSRSIRNVSFLGPEDEMVVVAPSTTVELAWGEHEEILVAKVDARVSWRSRLDGTRG